MQTGNIVRYMARHPWLSLAAGVGVAGISVLRIRRDRREKKEAKRQGRLERQETKALGRRS